MLLNVAVAARCPEGWFGVKSEQHTAVPRGRCHGEGRGHEKVRGVSMNEKRGPGLRSLG